MSGKDFIRMAEDLDEYYWEYEGFFGRKENSENARRFARGQLGPIERKSLEPIADAEGIYPRRLQLFFSRAEWDEDGARDYLQRRIAGKYGGKDVSWSMSAGLSWQCVSCSVRWKMAYPGSM